MARRHTRPKERKRPRPIPHREVAEKKELVKRPRSIPQELKEEQKVRDEYKRSPIPPIEPRKKEPDWEENVQRESPVEPEMRMMPEIPEMEEFDIQEYEKKKTKGRRKRIKKNPRKNWKELGLLEKRGLA